MTHKQIIKSLLVLIFILGFVVRFYKLGSVPPSLNWDEVAFGYNAYSIGTTGRDEFGKFLPYTALESFGDYKPPVYAYLDIIPIKIFGLNEIGVRFPSAFFGSLAILLTFFLVRQIFPKKQKEEKEKIDFIALMSSFLLAISPWHIMLSRGAFEANIASFFIILGSLFFFLGINSKKYYLIFSAIFLAIPFYTFNSARVFIPIFVLGLGVLFFKKLFNSKKEVLIATMIGFLLLAPLVPFLLSPQAGTRFKEVNIFSDPQIVINSNSQIEKHGNSTFAKIVFNRRVGYGLSFAKHYTDNLSPKFLFITGDGNPRFSIQKVGQLLIWELPFLIFGIYFLLKKREGYWYVVPFWLLIGIIPAAIAKETPHALRIESVIPMFQILVAYGFVYFMSLFSKRYVKFISILLIFLLLINFSYFYKSLMYSYPSKYASEWQYGYKQAVRFARENKNNYKKVYFTQRLGRPYVYYLFFNKISPAQFREDSLINRDVFGFVDVKRVDGNIFFVNNLSEMYAKDPDNLFIEYLGDEKDMKFDVPDGASVLYKMFLPNGKGLFVAYTRK